MTDKMCSTCREVKPLDEFHRNAQAIDGRQAMCKPCKAQHHRDWYTAEDRRKPWAVEARQARAEARARGNKTCARCSTEKPLDDFYKINNSRKSLDGRSSWCKVCQSSYVRECKARRMADPDVALQVKMHKKEAGKWRRLFVQYGLTREDYMDLLAKQRGRCGICGSEHVPRRTTNIPHITKDVFDVDHDHFSLVVRGLLCWSCNTGLGKLGDTAASVARALFYLLRSEIGTEDIDELLMVAEQMLRAAAKELEYES